MNGRSETDHAWLWSLLGLFIGAAIGVVLVFWIAANVVAAVVDVVLMLVK